MSVTYDEKDRLFTLNTLKSTYQLMAAEHGFLTHVYYGANVGGDRTFSLDVLPLEYPSAGVGDYRLRALDVIHESGVNAADLRYVGHVIRNGKYAVDGMPSFYERNPGDWQTLEITLRDGVSGITVTLLYGVLAELDIITRAAVITNGGAAAVKLAKAASLAVDFPFGELDVIHFYGRYGLEREMKRTPLPRGVFAVKSERGASSHHHNPGFLLAEGDADELHGNCYGFNLVYSGSFASETERDGNGAARVVSGLTGCAFRLNPGESFSTPEAVMTFSGAGFAKLSDNFHRAIRYHLQRGKRVLEKRPVVINNWEATYFDFTGEKLLAIARDARELGADTFVLDDGWFGERSSDDRALGDWVVNEGKLGMTLGAFAERVKACGLDFGLWFEPEMVSRNSRLYEARPDWALALPGREPITSRGQLVLDMSRDEVAEYCRKSVAAVLDSADIKYVKWDMNRNISDWYSPALDAGRMGELPHRYILGVYKLLERLTADYPDVLFEGCSGGGGRFDLGMLAYCPQIWCSDNTDAISRLKIQYGTSFLYPISAMAAHVSVSPNHQTGRVCPVETRALTALTGAFGFELNPASMSAEDKTAAKKAADDYAKYFELIANGEYYRLTSPYGGGENRSVTAWQFVSRDRSVSLVCIVSTDVGDGPWVRIKPRGLDENAVYEVDGKRYSGLALMAGGYAIKSFYGHFPSVALYIKKVSE